MPEEGKTDSESSCSFFGKRKAVTRKNEFRLQEIHLETLWQGHTLSSEMFFETPSAGAPPFCLTSSATSLQDAPHLSASRHLPRYRGSLPRFNGGIHLHQPGKRQDQNKKAYFYPFQSFYIQGKREKPKIKQKTPRGKRKRFARGAKIRIGIHFNDAGQE